MAHQWRSRIVSIVLCVRRGARCCDCRGADARAALGRRRGRRCAVCRSRPARSRRVSSASRWTSRDARRGSRPDAALHPDRLHDPRCVRRARRLRHRSERHRRQLRAPHAPGGDGSRTTSFERFSPSAPPMRRDIERSPICAAGAWRRWRRRWRTICSRLPRRNMASSSSRTRTTCIRIPIWRSDAWMPCCSTRCSPSEAFGAIPGSPISPPAWASGYYVGILAPENVALRERHRRDPQAGDARRPARGDLPAMEDVERRPAASLCARDGRRIGSAPQTAEHRARSCRCGMRRCDICRRC